MFVVLLLCVRFCFEGRIECLNKIDRILFLYYFFCWSDMDNRKKRKKEGERWGGKKGRKEERD